MKQSERYPKGAGNSALGFRIPDADKFWDFTGLAWVDNESGDTMPMFMEYPNAGDSVESRYEIEYTPPPGGPWPFEIVDMSSGTVVATGETARESDNMTGSNAVEITVLKTGTTTPIPGVYVTVKNHAGSLTLGVAPTDVNGQTKNASGENIIMLDPIAEGYTLYLRKSGAMFAVTELTQAEVESGTKTIYGDLFIPDYPPTAELQTLYMYVMQLDWDPSVSDIVRAEIASEAELINGAFIQMSKLESSIDSSGYAQLFVPKGASITVTIPKQATYNITVTNDETRNLADYFK